MKSKFAAISASALLLTTCSIPAAGDLVSQNIYKAVAQESQQDVLEYIIETKRQQTLLEQQIAENERLIKNRELIVDRIADLKKHVNKTWYVFSGSTPQGWDCSGLVMWFYEDLGVSLEHSATKQYRAGYKVQEPVVGDLVVFKYNDAKRAYHVGLYVSDNLMIHSGGKKGDRTEFQDIAAFAGNYSEVYYVRFIDSK